MIPSTPRARPGHRAARDHSARSGQPQAQLHPDVQNHYCAQPRLKPARRPHPVPPATAPCPFRPVCGRVRDRPAQDARDTKAINPTQQEWRRPRKGMRWPELRPMPSMRCRPRRSVHRRMGPVLRSRSRRFAQPCRAATGARRAAQVSRRTRSAVLSR